MSSAGEPAIRPYRADDREALYSVCLATGRNGGDASDLFRDPSLLGHRWVGPYLDLEPLLSYTLEDGDGPCGYVLGTDDSERFYRRFVEVWLPPVLATLPAPPPPGTARNEDERLLAELHAPTIVYPRDRAAYPAHAHIDLLPRAQGRGFGRLMMETLLHELIQRGVPGVHLGVGRTNTRAQGFYRTLGFTPIAMERDEPGALYLGRSLP